MLTSSSLRPVHDADLLIFHGELDLLSADELSERANEVIRAGSGDLVLDLTMCPFVDSSGLLSIVEASRELRKLERRMTIATDGPQVRRLLSVSGVDRVVSVCWTRAEAVESLGSGAA